jgi:hypothetical protein
MKPSFYSFQKELGGIMITGAPVGTHAKKPQQPISKTRVQSSSSGTVTPNTFEAQQQTLFQSKTLPFITSTLSS